MARTRKKGELFSHLTQMGVYRAGGGGNTNFTGGTAPAGVTAITVSVITGFTVGQVIALGSGENVELNVVQSAPSGNNIPLRFPTAFAHETLEPVLGQVLTDLGHLSDDGVSIAVSGDDNAIMSATRRQVLGYLQGHTEQTFECSLEGFNLENIATALGIAETAITGAGTSSSPNRLVTDAAKFRTENDLCFEASGVRKDGTIVVAQFWGVELDQAALTTALKRGDAALIPIRGRVTSAMAIQTYV